MRVRQRELGIILLIFGLSELTANSDARELVAELEFVWDQIKNNSITSSKESGGSSPPRPVDTRQFSRSQSGGKDGPMRILSPMSQDEDSEPPIDPDIYNDPEDEPDKKNKRWKAQVEAAMVKMTAEMAALREQIATGREWRTRKTKTIGAWLAWFFWVVLRHVAIDMTVLAAVLFWLRKKKDRRFEDLVRESLKLLREYLRQYLPAR